MKKEYVAPELEDLGSVAELTLGTQRALAFDSDWSAGKSIIGIIGKPGPHVFS